ncbi:MAG TPA: M48 family metalloprotease [Thermoplasmata archaeon]|nr:M48 family metalloprotease [Thermoplasmata archaeon]
MLPALVALLYVPVLVWISTGVVLLFAYRRSGPRLVLRLAAAFLGLWALLATTTLVWVLGNGGLPALARLTREPLALFEPQYGMLWLAGGAGAFAVLTLAFLLNQLVGRGFLHLLHPTPLRWPHRLPVPTERTSLLRYPSEAPEAFSFTLLNVVGSGRLRPHRHEVILLSDGLLARLTAEELEAVVAHELGHVRDLDARYLTFFRTLSRLMRWDPVLAVLAASLTRREEYEADDAAVALTRRPMALARALYKASAASGSAPLGRASAFLGVGGRRGRTETLRRIERLIALANSGAFLASEGA